MDSFLRRHNRRIKPEEKEQEKEAEALVCFLRSAFSDSFSEY
jgi:hypothetical protein